MNEYFLHFIWQYQFFTKQDLMTCKGERITILHPGQHNHDQGPDFSQARIHMDNMDWYGNVEIHIKASDWYLHKHQKDKNYDNIILHVVWENDCSIERENMSVIPVLELKDKVDIGFLDKYRTFINSGIQLPCQYYLKEIPQVHVINMFDKVLVERLERKANEIILLYAINKNDWEETFWQLLVRNFGFKINNAPFEQLARILPYRFLSKYSNNLHSLEALLFGQAGFLDQMPVDVYNLQLQKEYKFLSHKYSLENMKMDAHQWKFLRTRPYNFPSIRIAQLATLLNSSDKIINLVYGRKDVHDYVKMLETPMSSYWTEHYRFGEKGKTDMPGITESAIYNIIINVIIPFKTAQFLLGLNGDFPDEQFMLLGKMPAEINKITKEWERAGIKMKTAFDSQAAIELYNQYCLKRKCLYCKVGTCIIKN